MNHRNVEWTKVLSVWQAAACHLLLRARIWGLESKSMELLRAVDVVDFASADLAGHQPPGRDGLDRRETYVPERWRAAIADLVKTIETGLEALPGVKATLGRTCAELAAAGEGFPPALPGAHLPFTFAGARKSGASLFVHAQARDAEDVLEQLRRVVPEKFAGIVFPGHLDAAHGADRLQQLSDGRLSSWPVPVSQTGADVGAVRRNRPGR
jgi:hypothetical protein